MKRVNLCLCDFEGSSRLNSSESKMKIVVLVAVGATLVLCVQTLQPSRPCATPKQFHGNFIWVEKDFGGPNKPSMHGSGQFFYDGLNLRRKLKFVEPHSREILSLFKEGKEYMIAPDTGRCFWRQLNSKDTWENMEVPSNARHRMDDKIGGCGVKVYTKQKGSTLTYYTVTASSCLPVSMAAIGKKHWSETRTFGVASGVPSGTFVRPKNCLKKA